MPLIGQKERDFLVKEFSEKLVDDVTLVVFSQEMPCVFCKETVEVALELAQTSPKIKVEVFDFVKDQTRAQELRIDKIPAIAVIGAKDHGIRFYGIPSGYEFTSLIGAILDVSRQQSGLSDRSKQALRQLDRSVHIQVFVTPTCPYCPQTVRLAHRIAIESDMVWSDMIESNEFVPLAQKYGVMSVPKIVINEKTQLAGTVSEDLLIQHLLHSQLHEEPVQPR